MSDDFGFYGKGTGGYAHYMQSFQETQKGGGGDGRKPSSGGGCLTSVVFAFLIIGGVVLHLL